MSKRSYGQHCGVARALDVVGARWTLLIVRNLLLGPLRFTDLQRTLPGITPNLLADRLREMAEAEMVEKTRLPAPSGAVVYRLTERGRALEPAIHELGKWGWPYMAERAADDHADPAWGLLALTRRFLPTGQRAVLVLLLDDTPFTVSVHGDSVSVRRGAPAEAHAILTSTWSEMAGVFYGGVSIRSLQAVGALTVEGDEAAVEVFMDSFGLTS